ncbi:TPA: UvrD-helicase domain-containing protein [Stenotrophomonas maltophilia]
MVGLGYCLKLSSISPGGGVERKNLRTDMEVAWVGDTDQRRVAWADSEARMIVMAGPGTGKTEVSAQRLIHLLRSGLQPAQILVLSFSNSAVRTLTRRLEKQVDTDASVLEDLRYLAIRTFDSWTFRMLRLAGRSTPELMGREYDQNIEALVDLINSNEAEAIRGQLKQVRHVIVDEFQDLAGVRGALVACLLEALCENPSIGFTVLGDDAQAIYGFSVKRAGVDARYSHVSTAWLLSELRRQHPSVEQVVLDRNYRSTSELAANAQKLRTVVRGAGSGRDKAEKLARFVDDLPELTGALGYALLDEMGEGTVAILTRTNGEALQIAQKLGGTGEQADVKVRLGSGAKQRSAPGWIGALLGRIKTESVARSHLSRIYRHVTGSEAGQARALALCMPTEDVAWKRLLHASGSATGSTSFDLKELRNRMPWPDAFPDDEGVSDPTVRVLTVHQSKGMEFDSVGLFNASAPIDDAEEAALEAASLSFVAITRAGHKLVRLPKKSVYPLYQWRDGRGNSRWNSIQKSRLNVEIGQPKDLEALSFVDTTLHGGEDQVIDLQNFLAENSAELQGRKVMLCKRPIVAGSKCQVYGIHIQEGAEAGRLLGTTTNSLTFDLLRIIGKGRRLPRALFNLRIADVVTVLRDGDPREGISKEFSISGMWLGIQLHGVAFGPNI